MIAKTSQEQRTDSAYPPDTIIYDTVADEVGRVAGPDEYPHEYLGAACALVVPLRGNASAWQAEPGALRPATADEIEAAR
ncbi:hypothetical protein [Streptomyces natalensis]|uniref:Uncharacterized protein n=1 Tax=Streptomyces natalensis ATCC 27448 TaxID=1240678 RepID=A0A0D7CHF9_9ACTN|nr:hypothetical protein [Streptomyces natalensis]KIZ15648.1 hypothetical protein SNA_25890 [Streptomyces natalensis ATCC 27448]